MKRFLSLVLVIIMAMGLLVACGEDSKGDNASNNGGGNAPQTDDSVFSTDDVKYSDANGESVYRVVRPQSEVEESFNDKQPATAAATYLFKQFRTAIGLSIRNETDEKDGTDTYEILIGDTNRPETQAAKNYLLINEGGYKSDYLIGTIGKKIVIYSPNPDNLMAACEYFIENYAKPEGVAGGIKYVFKAKESRPAVTINGVSLGGFKVIRKHYNESYITQLQIDELVKIANETYDYPLAYYEDEYVTAGDYEIIIGNANREDVPQITNRDEYKITISGKKVYINGGSVNATSIAVSEFIKMLSKGDLTDADSVDGNYSSTVAGYDKSKYYTQVWGDDFDGSSVDATKWYHVPENSYSSQGMYGRTSVRSTDPNYVYVSDGKFVINAGYNDTQYIGGMLMTDRTMLYKYGYLEMSAILPDGDGLWTSLWLDSRWHGYTGTESAGQYYDMEIDVNECFGNATIVQANCHKWPTTLGESLEYEHTSLDQAEYSNAKRRTAKDEGNFTNEFHTFGLFWDEDEMTFTCDGEAYFTYNINTTLEDLDGLHVLSYIRLSAAIGFANNPRGVVLADDDPRWFTSNKFIVDYVYIYQLDDGVQQLVTGDAIFG